ncbi:MAG: hypothetical protein ACT4QE_22705 [Anaerolineales bacterium]
MSTPATGWQSISTAPRAFDLDSLSNGTAITPGAVGFYKENSMVCFHRPGHARGVTLTVKYKGSTTAFQVLWTGEVTQQLLMAYQEPNRATDNAACAIAMALMRELTGFASFEQSVLGTTIDYYLRDRPADDDLIFNRAARLEVSGILKENSGNTVAGRLKEKLDRLKIEGDLPDFVVVVEFGRPWSEMVQA